MDQPHCIKNQVNSASGILSGVDILRWAADRGIKFTKCCRHTPHKHRTKDGEKDCGTPGKIPFYSKWEGKPFTLEEILTHFPESGNAGALTGDHSGGVIMPDFDMDASQIGVALPFLHNCPGIRRQDAPDKIKLFIGIKGAMPESRKYHYPDPENPKKPQKHPFFEILSNGNQGVIAGTHASGATLELINADQPIPEFTTQEFQDQIVNIWCAGALEMRQAEAAAVRKESGNNNGDIWERVRQAWPTLEVFKRFGRADEIAQENTEELRLKNNGGLLVRSDGAWSMPGQGRGFGGGPFEAWQYCKTGSPKIPAGEKWALCCEMAAAAGIEIPKRDDTPTIDPPDCYPEGEALQLDPGVFAETIQESRQPVITTWADMEKIIGPITWAWEKWLPEGVLTILAGEPGAGKSALALRLAGCFLRGDPWPDGTLYTGEPGAIIWAEAEAGQALNLQRAKAWGLPTESIYAPSQDGLIDFNLGEKAHIDALARRAERPEVRLIIVDSLSGADARAEKSSEDAGTVKWLAALARDLRKPVLMTSPPPQAQYVRR